MNKQAEKEIRKTIHSQSSKNQIKYLGINLTKEVKALYNQNHKTLKEKTLENGKTSYVHGSAKLVL
jgi:hypothetical protein